MFLKRYVPILILAVLLASCSARTGMSLDQYEQLVPGISYETAALIAGGDGEMLPDTSGGHRPAGYYWHGFGENESGAILKFEDGLLTEKSQQGLASRQKPLHLEVTYDAFIDSFLQTVIFSAGGAGTGDVSLDSYDYEPRSNGEALRIYTVWQSPEGGFVRLQALCSKDEYVVCVETVYDSIAGNPEADAVYAKCASYALQAYLMAKYSLDVMDRDLAVLYDSMLSQGGLGFATITESQNGAVSTSRIAAG